MTSLCSEPEELRIWKLGVAFSKLAQYGWESPSSASLGLGGHSERWV